MTKNELAELMQTERSSLINYASYRLGNVDEAKDALQDVFLKIYTKLSDDTGSEVKNWRNYIFRSLSNLCASRLAEGGRRRLIPLDENIDIADHSTEFDEEDIKRITQLMKEIPEEQAEVIRLRIYGSNSFADVAEILSIPLPTVKSRFLYGLDKIRRAMKQTKH